jgi:Phage tail tube protein
MAKCPSIGGVAILRVDGYQYRLRGELKVSPSLVEREAVVGQDSVHGYIEKPRPPFISAKITDWGDVSLETLIAGCNVTVTAELQNGKVYVLRNAWLAQPPELDTAEGSFDVRWEGFACEELPAQAA